MNNSDTLLPEKYKQRDFLQATIGDFGRWQLRISILMALLKIPIAWFQLGIVFLAPPTEFWCKQPEDFKHMSIDKWKEHIKPPGNITSETACKMLNIEFDNELVHQKVDCKWGFEYDRSVVGNSIITEWNLVCDKGHFVDLVQITFMFGVLLGNLIFGLAADKFGRKKILMICIIAQSVFGIISAWSLVFIVFVITRFLAAIANGGTVIVSFVMCMEVVSGKWRTIIPILYQIPFGIGNSLMAIFAYYFRDWRELQLILCGLSTIYIFYYWFLSESPRWLLATKRKEEVVLVLQKAARFNKLETENIQISVDKYCVKGKREAPKFTALFSAPKLRKRTILLCINWFICGITFYAFSQYMGQVSKDVFFNVTIGGLIAIPGTLVCIVIIKRFGRRMTITCAHLFTAVCFFAILFLPLGAFEHDWPRIIFAGLGIFGLSISVPTLYLFTGELFPTIVRNTGVGGCAMFSKIGSVLAPLVISLQQYHEYLPLLVLGTLTVIEAVLILPLQEVHDDLPDTIKDIEMRTLSKTDPVEKTKFIAAPKKILEEETN